MPASDWSNSRRWAFGGALQQIRGCCGRHAPRWRWRRRGHAATAATVATAAARKVLCYARRGLAGIYRHSQPRVLVCWAAPGADFYTR